MTPAAPVPSCGDPALNAVLRFEQPAPEPGGAVIGDGIRLMPGHQEQESPEISWHNRTLARGGEHIGSVDYSACHACRRVLLGKISLVDPAQRRRIGSRTLGQLRAELPGYTWCTTAQAGDAEAFWRHMQRCYPGEYHDGGDELGRVCSHLATK